MSLLFQFINFLILAVILFFFLRKTLTEFFRKQREELEEKIADANREYDQMNREFVQIETAMKTLPARLEEMKSTSVRELEFESKRVESETQHLVQKITSDSEARIKQEIAKAKHELEIELLERSLQSAKDALSREFKSRNTGWIQEMLEDESEKMSKVKNYAS